MTRSRHATLTMGAGLLAGFLAIWFFNAPVIPAAVGIAGAVGYLLLRRPPAQ